MFPALNALGIVYLVDGQLDAAVATHTRAASLNLTTKLPTITSAWPTNGWHSLTRPFPMARRRPSWNPGNPHPWVALALAYWSSGDQVQAEANYWQALRLDGRYTSQGYLDHLEQAGFSRDQIDATGEIWALIQITTPGYRMKAYLYQPFATGWLIVHNPSP